MGWIKKGEKFLPELSKAELTKSLEIGAQEMLATEIAFEPDALMTTINVPDPEWTVKAKNV